MFETHTQKELMVNSDVCKMIKSGQAMAVIVSKKLCRIKGIPDIELVYKLSVQQICNQERPRLNENAHKV